MSDLILTAGDTTVKISSEGTAASTNTPVYTLDITAGGTAAVVSLENSALIVSQESKVVSYTQEEDLVLGQSPSLIISPIGAQGVQGEAGGNSTTNSNIYLPTNTAIGGNRAIATSGGYAVYADHNLLLPAVGISVGAVETGAEVVIQSAGKMLVSGANFVQDQFVFVGASGVLTQGTDGTGIIQQVGVAISSDVLLIGIAQPIYR